MLAKIAELRDVVAAQLTSLMELRDALDAAAAVFTDRAAQVKTAQPKGKQWSEAPEGTWDGGQVTVFLKKSDRWLATALSRKPEQAGSIPHGRLGCTAYFFPDQIKAWLAAGCPPAIKFVKESGDVKAPQAVGSRPGEAPARPASRICHAKKKDGSECGGKPGRAGGCNRCNQRKAAALKYARTHGRSIEAPPPEPQVFVQGTAGFVPKELCIECKARPQQLGLKCKQCAELD